MDSNGQYYCYPDWHPLRQLSIRDYYRFQQQHHHHHHHHPQKSTQSKRKHKRGRRQKSACCATPNLNSNKLCNTLIGLSLLIVFIIVIAIAVLAIYIGMEIILDGSLRVTYGDYYISELNNRSSQQFLNKAHMYQLMIDKLFRYSVMGPALKQCSIMGFRNGSLIVFYRLVLDRRKISSRMLVNIEETAKKIIFDEVTSLKPKIFTNMRFDPKQIFIKRNSNEIQNQLSNRTALQIIQPRIPKDDNNGSPTHVVHNGVLRKVTQPSTKKKPSTSLFPYTVFIDNNHTTSVPNSKTSSSKKQNRSSSIIDRSNKVKLELDLLTSTTSTTTSSSNRKYGQKMDKNYSNSNIKKLTTNNMISNSEHISFVSDDIHIINNQNKINNSFIGAIGEAEVIIIPTSEDNEIINNFNSYYHHKNLTNGIKHKINSQDDQSNHDNKNINHNHEIINMINDTKKYLYDISNNYKEKDNININNNSSTNITNMINKNQTDINQSINNMISQITTNLSDIINHDEIKLYSNNHDINTNNLTTNNNIANDLIKRPNNSSSINNRYRNKYKNILSPPPQTFVNSYKSVIYNIAKHQNVSHNNDITTSTELMTTTRKDDDIIIEDKSADVIIETKDINNDNDEGNVETTESNFIILNTEVVTSTSMHISYGGDSIINDNMQSNRQFSDSVDNMQSNKQLDSVENMQPNRQFSDSVDNMQSNRQFSNSVDNMKSNKQLDSVENMQPNRHFSDSVDNMQSNRQFSDSVDNMQSNKQFSDSVPIVSYNDNYTSNNNNNSHSRYKSISPRSLKFYKKMFDSNGSKNHVFKRSAEEEVILPLHIAIERYKKQPSNDTLHMIINHLATLHTKTTTSMTPHFENQKSEFHFYPKVTSDFFKLTKPLNKAIVTESATVAIVSESINTTECPSNTTFRCLNGDCISLNSWCNQLKDCSDGSDEKNCTCADYLRAQFSYKKLCDGIADCWDYSDENTCEWCTPEKYVCSNAKLCIEQNQLCDGSRDCPQGDDEHNCIAISPNIKKQTDVTYYASGFVTVRRAGQWGKLCFNHFGKNESTSESLTKMSELGRAVCRSMTYRNFVRISKVPDENYADNSNSVYYKLTQIAKSNLNSAKRKNFKFVRTRCDSKEVIQVKCTNLECGIQTEIGKTFHQGRYRGDRRSRIVGGGSAAPGAWPWQAALYKEGEFQCGATLISDKWLLSAGHCFYNALNDYWVARLGILRRGSTLPSPYEQVYSIHRIILHPGYIDNGFINDISLLEMKKPVHFTNFVRPVCLPQPTSVLPDGTMCTVIGWGQLLEVGRVFPDTLQEVQLPVISTTECQKRTLYLPLYKVTDNMLCAGFERGGRDACLGDSGGPLMCQDTNDGSWQLHGVTSNGYGCARPNRPGVYTKVANYITWITEIIHERSNLNVTKPQQDVCNGHRCPLGECLPKVRICNGYMECSDGSDEKGC